MSEDQKQTFIFVGQDSEGKLIVRKEEGTSAQMKAYVQELRAEESPAYFVLGSDKCPHWSGALNEDNLTYEEAFDQGILHVVDDPEGVTKGMHGSLYYA